MLHMVQPVGGAVAELFIDGQWRPAADGATRDIRCPADGSFVATVAEASEVDTLAAIAAARAAFDDGDWSTTPMSTRGGVLAKVADLLERDAAQIARAEALDTGKRFVEAEYDIDGRRLRLSPLREARSTQHPNAASTTSGATASTARIRKEPIGVCALITPWNYPLLQASWKIAPALLAGNTFVLKPSEITPHSSVRADPRPRRGRRAGRGRQSRPRHRRPAAAGRSPATPASPSSRSPAAWPSGDTSWRRPHRRSSAWRWNSAARTPTSSSPTPIARRPSTTR
jgi:hypothetical protein